MMQGKGMCFLSGEWANRGGLVTSTPQIRRPYEHHNSHRVLILGFGVSKIFFFWGLVWVNKLCEAIGAAGCISLRKKLSVSSL